MPVSKCTNSKQQVQGVFFAAVQNVQTSFLQQICKRIALKSTREEIAGKEIFLDIKTVK